MRGMVCLQLLQVLLELRAHILAERLDISFGIADIRKEVKTTKNNNKNKKQQQKQQKQQQQQQLQQLNRVWIKKNKK